LGQEIYKIFYSGESIAPPVIFLNCGMKILVLGIGNVLMGDEGVGVHAIRFMEEREFPPSVKLLDGGTGGFHMLSWLEEYEVIIMIDATLDGKEPGTLTRLRPRFASDFPRSLSSHDIGLKDLIESSVLLGDLPDIHLITVSVRELDDVKTELSDGMEGILPEIHKTVREILKEYV
jgi:hydrogenase maturation protease